MNPIEKTIRNALDKGDAGDRAFREKVYRSVHSALERSLQNNPDLSADVVQQRRQMLKESIRSIETEFVPASAPVETPAPSVPPPVQDLAAEADDGSAERVVPKRYDDEGSSEASVPTVEAVATEPEGSAQAIPVEPDVRSEPPVSPEFPFVEPRTPRDAGRRSAPASGPPVEGPRPGSGRREPSFGDDAEPDRPAADDVASELRGERRTRPRRRSRFFALAFLTVTLLAAIGMGIWWTIDQGLFLSAEQRDTSVPNPPLALEEEEFVPEGTPPSPPPLGVAADTAEWITIFNPSDPTRVTTPPGAEAAVVEADGGPVLRIRTSSADEPVTFDVGQGVLEQIAGRQAVFDVVAAAQEGEPTQISVTCDFGTLGDCGRRRFDVTGEQTEFLFNVEVPAGDISSAGLIAVASDVENQGRAVDIREIRVSVQD